MRVIRSVANGQSIMEIDMFYSCKMNTDIERIEEEEKVVGKGYHNDLTLVVYRAYNRKDGRMIKEIFAGPGVEVTYFTDEK